MILDKYNKITDCGAVILVEPQLGENIGTVARAMANFGFVDLRLVAPRDGWPNPGAAAAAAGADFVLNQVRVFTTIAAATADCNIVYSTSARPRDLAIPSYSLHQATTNITRNITSGATNSDFKYAFVFGCERSGLTNDQLSFTDAVVSFPVNPDFTSLNLAQAVLLVCYELSLTTSNCYSLTNNETTIDKLSVPPAKKRDINLFFSRLEHLLAASNYFDPPEKMPKMRTNLRALLMRASINGKELQSLHGVITALSGGKGPNKSNNSG